MLTIRAMSNGAGYAKNHLEQNDYYAEGEKVVGRWFGKGAAQLELHGLVEQAHFEAIREGKHPFTQAMLRQRKSADRVSLDGTKQSEGRSLYDFTFSAPKSVSIMAGAGNDPRLSIAHDRAVEEALIETERWAATRVRVGGQNADRITGNLVVAVYVHSSSRELDPQIHTHAVAGNQSFDEAEQRWKALQAGEIYQRRAYLTAVYRAVLRHEVHLLGYETVDKIKRGRDFGFEIKGVSNELIEKFSQRSKQRDDAIAAFTQRTGRIPTDNEISVLVRETRASKLTHISTEEVKQRQLDRLSPREAEQLSQLRAAAQKLKSRDIYISPESFLDHAISHSFERVSVVRDYEILTEALRYSYGASSLHAFKASMDAREARGELIRAGIEIATTETLRREKATIELVNRDLGRLERLGGVKEFAPSTQLTIEQNAAIQFIVNCRDRAVGLQGAAGAGKTATLGELRRGLEEAHRPLFAVAPTASAADELKKVGFRNAITIERLLQDQERHLHLSGHVVVVDEAGMISGRQMHALLELAVQHNARLIFSGDTRQLQSVEAIDALRILEKESKLTTVTLQQVQRQKKVSYRDAIQTLRRDAGRGFEKLERLGGVSEVDIFDRAEKVATAYRNAVGEKLVVCPTHEEIFRVTAAIRSDRLSRGELVKGCVLNRLEALQFTEAQKRDFTNYEPGQVIVFHRETKAAHRGEVLTVLRHDQRQIIARNEHGQDIAITRKQAAAFGVFEKLPIEVSSGDPLLIQANTGDRTPHFTNGEIVLVKQINPEGTIHLEDGRTIPKNFAQFNHAYAVTAHKSQGRSVDEVIISGDFMKKELFYVAASRGRHRIQIFTSDKESLRIAIGLSAQRQSALELARKAARTVNRSRTADRPNLTLGYIVGELLAKALRHFPFRERFASQQKERDYQR